MKNVTSAVEQINYYYYYYLKSEAVYDSCAKNQIPRISECYTAMKQVMYTLFRITV